MLQESTILLAEDDPNDVLLMKRAFNRARLANPLKIVPDGEEAVAYLAGHGLYGDREHYPFPFLLLLDLKMPKKSGLEVLEWIRSQPHFNELAVVVLTSSEEQPNMQKAFQLGASSYLVKPAEFEDLVEMMRRLHGYWLLVNKKADRMALLVEEPL
jgi:CheY-like chemotaxis protein